MKAVKLMAIAKAKILQRGNMKKWRRINIANFDIEKRYRRRRRKRKLGGGGNQ